MNVLTKANRLTFHFKKVILGGLAHFELQFYYCSNSQKFLMITYFKCLNSCMNKIEPRMQICWRNPRIACSTDHVNNIPLTELKFEFKK
jgi:hypothetical protein